ncbi:MAG: hypothetical protein WCR69_08085 [Sulfuricurvum sp.]
MNQKSINLFRSADMPTILDHLQNELASRNESPIWREKVIPFATAILSVLVPLYEQKLLFDPQGRHKDELSAELFFQWSDFVSLKMLAFTLQRSNEASKLLRTKIDESLCENYKSVDLTALGEYLSKNRVDLSREDLDFPISTYNLHQGVSNVIRSLL